MAKERLAILVGPKGRGTNMGALAEACRSGEIDADVSVVVSPKADNPAAIAALERGLRLAVVAPGEGFEADLLDALDGATAVCLAGFMRLLPEEALNRFPGRVFNIHPSLLPKFGGKGMYGLRVHEAVIAAGERESGCTVHLVTEVYDEGPIVLQMRCEVLPDDTPETLAARVLELEKIAYPAAVSRVIDGR